MLCLSPSGFQKGDRRLEEGRQSPKHNGPAGVSSDRAVLFNADSW